MPNKLILCAEDDPDDFELFCNTATKLDSTVEVIHAENGRVLLNQLEDLTLEGRRPCMIVLDMNMPVMDGKETVMHLKSNDDWKSIPTVVYSTSSRQVYWDLERDYGVLVLTKPHTPEEIIDSVTLILSKCKD